MFEERNNFRSALYFGPSSFEARLIHLAADTPEIRFRYELADVAAQECTDVAERGVDGSSHLAHSSRCRQCNQSDHQGILNQILALILREQALDLYVEFQQRIFHFV